MKPETYQQLKYVIPGAVVSALVLAVLLALSIYWSSYGWILVVAVPFACGVIMGYLTELNNVLLWMVTVIAVFCAIGGLITASMAGFLCGVIVAMVIIVPMAVGASFGLLVRTMQLRREQKMGRRNAMAGLLLATTGLLWAEAQMPLPVAVEEVQTTRVLAADRMEAWDRLVFYEEVGAEPPRLTRIGLPYPIGTEGLVDEVGDTKRCLYKGGHLVKLITDFRPGERFAFDVIEQVGIEESLGRVDRRQLRIRRSCPGANPRHLDDALPAAAAGARRVETIRIRRRARAARSRARLDGDPPGAPVNESRSALLASQGNDRVDSRSSPRRHEAGSHRRQAKAQRDGDIGDWVGGRDLEQHSLEEP